MNKTIAGVAIAASLWCSANSQAGPEDETLERTCPHAAQAGKEAKAALARRQPPILHVTRPALQRELVEMEERDQAARDAWIEDITDRDSPQLRAVEEIDTANLRRLKHILQQDGSTA